VRWVAGVGTGIMGETRTLFKVERGVCGGERRTTVGWQPTLGRLTLAKTKDRVGVTPPWTYDSCIPCDLRPGS